MWANWAEVDEVSRGTGKVIPSSSIQVIQSLEGGIIDEIFVSEGQQVKAGAPLLRLRDTIFSASYQENLAHKEALDARLCRLQAEADGAKAITFPPHINKDLAKREVKLFETRLADYKNTQESYQKTFKLVKEEYDLLIKSRETGAVSAIDVLRVRKELSELEGAIKSTESTRRREAMEAYDQDKAQLEALTHALKKDKDRLDRTVITSPVTGTVNKIYINTVGRIIQSGVDIMDIVPSDDTLLIEANLSPSDIAFIKLDQKVKVKVTAYDFAVYGGLDGVVTQIGTNTIVDEEGNSFYQIKVETDRASLGTAKNGEEMNIIPGMIVECDVLTGRKTVLSYLLNPFLRAKERAFTEK